MATLNLQTSDAGFINSGDMRLILRGYAPTIVVEQPANQASPPAGSLSFGSDAPSVVGSWIGVPSGSLGLVGHSERWGVGLVLQGYAPTLGKTFIVEPGAGSVGFTANSPLRAYGLVLQGNAPQIGESRSSNPLKGSMSFSGKVPQVSVSTSTNTTKAPETVDLTLTPRTPARVVNENIAGAITSISFAGAAPTVRLSQLAKPGKATLSIVGKRPTLPQNVVTVIIGEAGNQGTVIRNTNAVTIPSNYLIDDRTGFKVKIKKGLSEQWDGVMTRSESYDSRHPQEFVRSRPERIEGPERPEGSDRFIEDEYPDGVSQDDL